MTCKKLMKKLWWGLEGTDSEDWDEMKLFTGCS